MGTLHPLYEDRKHALADHQYPYSDNPLSNAPIVVTLSYKYGQDIAALKHNILTAHALGMLPTRKLFESIHSQGTLDLIQSNAAIYAQSFIDEYTKTLTTLSELEQFDEYWKYLYRQKMTEYIATVTEILSSDPVVRWEEVTVL